MHKHFAIIIAGLLTTAACDRGEPEKTVELAETSEKIEAVEAPKSVSAMSFAVDSSDAKVGFEMQAPFEKQDGTVPPSAVSGEFNADLSAFSKSTGLVDVQIDQLEIYMQKAEQEGAYGERTKNDNQNAHMKDWLEIGESAPADERAKNSLVQFALESIEGASAEDINALEGAERKVTFTGVGKFRLHQRSSEQRVKLVATFTYEGDAPTGVRIETVEPFVVSLDEHDVRPRKGFGVLAAKTLEAMAPKVAKDAKVSVSFSAKPK